MKTLAAFLIAFSLPVLVFAQGNLSTVDQIGGDNQTTVTQGGALLISDVDQIGAWNKALVKQETGYKDNATIWQGSTLPGPFSGGSHNDHAIYQKNDGNGDGNTAVIQLKGDYNTYGPITPLNFVVPYSDWSIYQVGHENSSTQMIFGNYNLTSQAQIGSGNIATMNIGMSAMPSNSNKSAQWQEGNGNITVMMMIGMENEAYNEQHGDGNKSTVVQAGTKNKACVSQFHDNNESLVSQSGTENLAIHKQDGMDNYANTNQSGCHNDSWVEQIGSLNISNVTQDGNMHESDVTQHGSSNTATVTQMSAIP